MCFAFSRLEAFQDKAALFADEHGAQFEVMFGAGPRRRESEDPVGLEASSAMR
jgi:hypothetical protein